MKARDGCAIALLICSWLSPRLFSQAEESDDGRLSQASVAASEEQTRRIQRELRQLKNHEWAGEYYFGDGLGMNVRLTLAPSNGFVSTLRGCLGLYDLNYGGVSFTNSGTVKLEPQYPAKWKGLGIASELVPVRWGERHYLIPVDGMVEFTNAINSGEEPSSLFGGKSLSFLLRRGDEKKPVRGLPSIPSEYLSYILAQPIKAKILSLGQTRIEKDHRITYVSINVGSADGLKERMELYVKRPSTVYGMAVVTDVSAHSATAMIEQDRSDPVPAVGWEFSTKL